MSFAKTRYGLVTVLLAVAALMLVGCGGDDNGGLSSEDMARIAAAEDAATAAQAAADDAAADLAAAQDELADLQAQVEDADAAEADGDADTSALDDAIAALQMQIAALIEKTADPETPLAILGGEKSAMSANDRAALAKMIAGQLSAAYDHDGDKGMVNLAEISPGEGSVADPDGDGATITDMMTRNIAHASGAGISSSDGSSTDGGFLKHSFTGGPMVDLTSPGDIETLSLTNLLDVNGVSLKSFTLKETDKVRTAPSNAAGFFVGEDPGAGTAVTAADTTTHTTTRTLGADGSVTSVTMLNTTKQVVMRRMTTYVGGNKIVETPTAAGDVADPQAMVTLADGRTATYDTVVATPELDYTRTPAGMNYNTRGDTALPAADLANALRTYATAGAAYTIAQHNAKGYGAWLEDSFFAAYVMNAEDDAIIQDPDSTVMKIAWGGRAHDSEMASNLSGRGETAHWKGLMVGHDMDAEAATHGKMLKGNAMITARVGEATLADNQAARTPDIVDVMLSNIITADGTAVSRVADGIEWTNLDLTGGSFAKGSEIEGQFYDNGNEVVGQFDKEDILGVFGAMEYEGDMMDMASGN